MRLQEFWAGMRREFGDLRATSIASDHVFTALGGRTAVGAIEASIPIRTVWLAVCEEYDVPPAAR